MDRDNYTNAEWSQAVLLKPIETSTESKFEYQIRGLA